MLMQRYFNVRKMKERGFGPPSCEAHGFTLIELLVVVAIIAILSAILFPVFAKAREKARQTSCLSNLKQLGLGLQMYVSDYESYPMMSSPSSFSPRQRWADYLYPYVKNPQVFLCPSAPENLANKTFAHDASIKYGGYGFNYQYLGNSRFPWTASDAEISAPAETIAITDTNGVAYDANPSSATLAGLYTVDPPLTSARGSGKASGSYGDGAECGGAYGCRAMPAERHNNQVNVAFADGHAKPFKLAGLDDRNADGTPDNGYWNGRGDPSAR